MTREREREKKIQQRVINIVWLGFGYTSVFFILTLVCLKVQETHVSNNNFCQLTQLVIWGHSNIYLSTKNEVFH